MTIRVRKGKAGEWKEYATTTARKPVSALAASGATLAAADMTKWIANQTGLAKSAR